MRLNVYIPAPKHYMPAAQGSGIVGTETRDSEGNPTGSVVVDYEGNVFGASNIRTWADRLHHAASRHVHNYPTSARSLLPREALQRIGWYDPASGALYLNPEAELLLCDWLGVRLSDLARESVRSPG